MSDRSYPLTGKNRIAEWLASPVGGRLLRSILEEGGQNEESLAPVLQLPLNDLVVVSRGAFSQETVDHLVRSVNGGEIPVEKSDVAASRFHDKTIIITGAASGIGRATAERVLQEGGRVIAVDLAVAGLEDLVGQYGDAVIAVGADISDSDDVDRIRESAGSAVHGLANIAGIMDGMLPLHEVTDDVWARVQKVNVDGTFKLMRAVIPVLRENGGGSIVNVASEAALRANAAGTAYTVSKHAVVGLTQSAAFLYGREGIRVNAVAPGPTATGMGGDFRSEFAAARLRPFLELIPPVATADALASSITWLLSSDASNINGVVLPSDGGWHLQ